MKKNRSGIALLEALLAILILAIGLLGVIGLQARAYSALSDAGMRAEATIATEKLLGVMANDQARLADYALAAAAAPQDRLTVWYDETRSAIPGATILISVTPTVDLTRTEVVVAISWTRKKGDTVHTHKVTSYIASSS